MGSRFIQFLTSIFYMLSKEPLRFH
jgi:hypothetical protein